MRKPLVLRGARQVGKTWLIRDFAKRHGKELIEINFEQDPNKRTWFESNHPDEILKVISLALNRTLDPEKIILFLDEIQVAGEVLAKLRWFAENMPQLPVIAAGSLLEFTLADHSFSMPVGRIKFLHIEPMCFTEFLEAHQQAILHEHLLSWKPGMEFSPVLHEKALEWFHRYIMVGGMPGIVANDVAGFPPETIRELQHDLIATYRADFSKYAPRIDPRILNAALLAVSRSLGRKFVYAGVGQEVKQHQAKMALELLTKARVCHLITFSAANGIPLGGESKSSFQKAVLNDVGMLHALMQTPALGAFPKWDDLAPQVRGQISEQIVAQQLRMLGPASGDGPMLHYWQREGGRPGEIDFLIQAANKIIPIELKSGVNGAMKSLHQFMFDKNLDFAIRFDRNPPSQLDVSVKTTQGNPVRYRLLSLPVYLAAMADRLIEARF